MMKVPIETLPVELRIKIYELGDIGEISIKSRYSFIPWARTILMSGILNDKDALEIAAIQEGEPRKIMCDYIALSGNLPMMKWARSDKASKKDDAAAEERLIKQIRLDPFPWDEETCRNAAWFGHFNLVKWLHEQGCPWHGGTFSAAARLGNIDMMEWLYQKKCPWDQWTFSWAVESENLDVLKWLHDRKCPWDVNTFRSALFTGNLDMVKWLHEQKCPWEKFEISAVDAEKGDFMVKWLVDHGLFTLQQGTDVLRS
jgi:hypothetical protein